MRVEIIVAQSKEILQRQVNEFLKNSWLSCIGIEYQTYVRFNEVYYSCMVIYDEVQYEKSR